jgi:hypothetical protein
LLHIIAYFSINIRWHSQNVSREWCYSMMTRFCSKKNTNKQEPKPLFSLE